MNAVWVLERKERKGRWLPFAVDTSSKRLEYLAGAGPSWRMRKFVFAGAKR